LLAFQEDTEFLEENGRYVLGFSPLSKVLNSNFEPILIGDFLSESLFSFDYSALSSISLASGMTELVSNFNFL